MKTTFLNLDTKEVKTIQASVKASDKAATEFIFELLGEGFTVRAGTEPGEKITFVYWETVSAIA